MDSHRKQKIAYLHGLHSSPKPEKVAVLQNYSEQTVYAPQIDYENNPAVFSEILAACQGQKIDFIVGSSAGGLLGFWLSRHLGIQALLYNPPLYKSDLISMPKLNTNDTTFFCQIIQGMQDDVVSPQETRTYLEVNVASIHYKIEEVMALAHQIDMETFRQISAKYL